MITQQRIIVVKSTDSSSCVARRSDTISRSPGPDDVNSALESALIIDATNFKYVLISFDSSVQTSGVHRIKFTVLAHPTAWKLTPHVTSTLQLTLEEERTVFQNQVQSAESILDHCREDKKSRGASMRRLLMSDGFEKERRKKKEERKI